MGLFSFNKPIIGIDIGAYSVKIAQLKEIGRTYQLVAFGEAPIHPEAIVDGAIMDSGAIVSAIHGLVSELNLKSSNVATAIYGSSVIVKKIPVPEMDDAELAESIQWEAEQYIPFDIDEVNISFQILSKPEVSGKSEMDVILVAAKKEKLNELQNIITQAGLDPLIIEVDAFSLQNCFEINYEAFEGTLALINIGAQTMSINILENGVSNLTRYIQIGGNNYTDAIQRDFNLKYEEAELIKKGVKINSKEIDQKALGSIYRQISGDIISEIQRSFDFYRSSSTKDKIDKIFLSGGCIKIKGLVQYMAQKLGIPVEILNPFRNIEVSDKLSLDEIQEKASQATIAIGLALRKVGD